MNHHIVGASLVTVLLVLSCAAANGARAPAFSSIDFPGAVSTTAYGINSVGDIVGAYTDAPGKTNGYLLRRGKFKSIEVPGARSTEAWGINDRRQIVGRYQSSDGRRHGFLLAAGMFTTIDYPGALHTVAVKISPNGTIVGCYHDVVGPPWPDMHGFVKTRRGFKPFGVIGSMHNGIALNGNEIAGLFYDPVGKRHAYFVRNGKYIPFDYPRASDTTAQDVKHVAARARGRTGRAPGVSLVVGHYLDSAGRRHGFVLAAGPRARAGSPGRFSTIDIPGGTATEVYGINAKRETVGVYVDSANKSHGFRRKV